MKTQLPLPTSLGRLLTPAILALPLLGLSAIQAREYEPFVMYVFPAGAQRGTTTEGIMARGRGLEGTNEIRVSGEGVTAQVLGVEKPSTRLRQRSANRQDQAENPNVVKFSVTIAPDAPVGERDLWFITPKGPTNRLHFVVGQLPEVNEADETETKGEPQALSAIPILVNGQYNQQDHDIFRFPAKAGQTLVCEVQGQKLVPYIADAVPGWFQPCLTLYDSDGEELAFVDDFRFHPDPLLIYHVEKDGEYLIDVRDALFRGREDLVYRLSIGALPYLTHIFPLGGQRGTETPVELHGVNLDTAATTLSLPGDATGFLNKTRHVRTTGNGLMSNALPFAVGDTPEFTETEPNDSPDQANKIELPRTINGRIQQKGDIDYFAFSAKKGERFVMDVRARRLESPIDSIITLFNADGRLLAENDDTTDLSEGLITHHADSYLAYTFPADGDYVVRLADIETQGGEQYAYRLTIAPPRPNFDLRLFPANLSLARGAAAMVKVRAYRRDGFNGEIDVAFEGLPAGFVAAPATIPAGQTEIRTTITAPPDAPLGIISPTLKGTAIVPKSGNPVAEKKAAEEALANVKTQVAAATTAQQAAEKAAQEAESAAATAKTEADKAADAAKAAQAAADEKRKLADAAKAKRDKLTADEAAANAKLAEADQRIAAATVHRQAVPAEELMQAFYYWHDVPTEELLLAVIEPNAFTLSTSIPSAQVHDVRQESELSVVVKVSRDGLKATIARAEAAKKTAEEAVAKVKADLEKAKASYAAAEQAAKAAEAAVPKAKAAAAQAATAETNAQKAAAAKRRQANEAKAKLDALVAKQQKPAEANVAAAAKAVTAATAAKAAADKALADATAATASFQQASEAAEKAAQEAEAAAKAVGEDAAKSEEEKKQATDQAGAKRKEADDAKAALTQAQQTQQQAKTQVDAAAGKLTQAQAQKKSADEALANVNKQVTAATTAHQAADKAAQQAEAAAATAKAEADKARTAQAAAEKDAPAKRAVANEAKAKSGLLANDEKAASATLAERSKRIESLDKLAKAAISLKADPAPRGITVKAANIAADQNETTVTLTVTKGAPVGFRQNIVLVGTLRVGPETIIRVAPAIPINVLAAEPPKK